MVIQNTPLFKLQTVPQPPMVPTEHTETAPALSQQGPVPTSVDKGEQLDIYGAIAEVEAEDRPATVEPPQDNEFVPQWRNDLLKRPPSVDEMRRSYEDLTPEQKQALTTRTAAGFAALKASMKAGKASK